MNKLGKIWGSLSTIFNQNNVLIQRAIINKDQSCSKHYHKYKYNIFFVEKGSIIVDRWENNIKISTLLNEGESITIDPEVYHKFISLEDSIIYEIYYTTLLEQDIVRDNNEF